MVVVVAVDDAVAIVVAVGTVSCLWRWLLWVLLWLCLLLMDDN